MDARHEYYKEAVQTSLDEMGKYGVLTEEEVDTLVDDLIVGIENEGLYSGQDSIPNPVRVEFDNYKRESEQQHEQERDEHESAVKRLTYERNYFAAELDRFTHK